MSFRLFSWVKEMCVRPWHTQCAYGAKLKSQNLIKTAYNKLYVVSDTVDICLPSSKVRAFCSSVWINRHTAWNVISRSPDRVEEGRIHPCRFWIIIRKININSFTHFLLNNGVNYTRVCVIKPCNSFNSVCFNIYIYEDFVFICKYIDFSPAIRQDIYSVT